MIRGPISPSKYFVGQGVGSGLLLTDYRAGRLVPDALDKAYGARPTGAHRLLVAVQRAPRRPDDVDRDDAHVAVAEDLERGHGRVVRRRERRVAGRLHERAQRPRVALQVPEERAVVARHVRLHALQERTRGLRRRRR